MANNQAGFNTNANITEQWNGGYKLEIDLTAESSINDWQVDFNLPNTISEVFGVDLVDNGNNSYSFSGQDYNNNLNAGDSTKAIFIISNNANGNEAVLPEFNFDSPATSSTTFTVDTNEIEAEIENEIETEIIDTAETVKTEAEAETDFTIESQGITNSQPGSGQFAYGEALQKSFLLYEANRSGDLGDDNRLEWRDDSAIDDGSDVGLDLTGGYYDAGDHVKFGLPMAATSTMLAWGGIEYQEAYQQAGQFDELLESVKWATDYFLKAHVTENGKTKEFYAQVGDGDIDHAVWTAPEDMQMERPAFKVDAANTGSDVTAGTAAALASASMLFRGTDDAYADKLLKNAEQLFEFADTYRGKYSDSIPQANPFYTSFSGYGDELAEGAVWMYKATGEQQYLDRAEAIFDREVGYPSDWTWMTDNKSNSAALLLAQESDDPKYQQMTEQWLDSWVEGTGNVQYSEGGMAFRAGWGSLALSSSAAFLAELYNDTVKPDAKYADFANNQIDYVLGDNPRDFSYMIGFGDNYAQQPHHRGSTGNAEYGQAHEHILYGALVGGPGSTDDFDYNDDRNDWITNEVGTSYNAPLTSALIQQYDNFGGDPLTEEQFDELVGVDADGVGF